MDILSTPWTPTLRGNACASFPLYEDFIEEDPIPNCIEHTTWAESTLDPELKKTPSGRAALWEGILALWRLKTYEENGTNEESWRNLVSAWLHRHRDLCWHLNIAPFKTILDYADALRATQYLPAEMIPSWDKPKPAPVSESEPTPKAKQNRKRSQKLAITPSRVPSEDDEDVEMEEVVRPYVAIKSPKNKQRAKSNVPADVSGSQQEGSNTGKAGSKRGFQESPSQARRESKRRRGPSEESASREGIDLGELSLTEDSPIDTTLVPALEGVTCGRCQLLTSKAAEKKESKRSKKPKTVPNCLPLWHRRGKSASVRCEPCLVSKKGCSLKSHNWDISVWPKLKLSQASINRRAKETEAKRNRLLRSREKKTTGKPKVERGQGSPQRKRVVMKDVLIPPASPALKRAIETARLPTPIATSTPLNPSGTTYSIFLQDILPFEEVLLDPAASKADCRMKTTELRNISIRESEDIEGLTKLANSRSEVIAQLAKDLSDAGSDEEDETEDVGDDDREESSSEDNHSIREEYGDEEEDNEEEDDEEEDDDEGEGDGEQDDDEEEGEGDDEEEDEGDDEEGEEGAGR